MFRRLIGGLGGRRLDGVPGLTSAPGGTFSASRTIVAPEYSGDVESGGGGSGLFRSPGELGEGGISRNRDMDVGVPGGVLNVASRAVWEDIDEA